MKRFVMWLLVFAIVVPAFADDAKPKSQLYGKFRADYDLTQAMVEAAQPLYGGFNFDRVRFGFTTMMLDNLQALLELELKPTSTSPTGKFELRIAEVDWKIAEMFTFSAGRMYEAFAPYSDYWGSRFDGLGVLLDFGMIKVKAQVGNDKDTGFTPGGHITAMPGIIFTPNLGDASLEAGLNGKAKFDTTKPTPVLQANAYAMLKLAGLYALVDFDANYFDTAATTYLNLFSEINYKIGIVTPGIKLWYVDLSDNLAAGGHFDIEPYIAFEFVKGLSIQPRLNLTNLYSSNSTPLTWTFTLRVEWNPKVAF